MQNKAVYGLLILLLTEGLLLGLAAVWPTDSDNLRFATLEEVLRLGPAPIARPDSAVNQLLADRFLQDVIEEERDSSGIDTVDFTKYNYFISSRVDTVLSDTLSINRMFNPVNEDGRYALDPFFDALTQQTGKTVRIAHYGDSQIEGDRITQFLRAHFQQHFGGGGLGYIPLVDEASHHGIVRATGDNWRRYNVFSDRYNSGLYGLSGCVFRYQPALTPQKAQETAYNGPPLHAEFKAKIGPYVRYNRLNLLWGQAPAAVRLQVRQPALDSLMLDTLLPPRIDFTVTPLPLPVQSQIELVFESAVSPDIYGLQLEAGGGVQIDNFALRGHSGHELYRIQNAFAAAQIQTQNYKFFIFQYGGNMAPYEVKDFHWFEDQIFNMLMRYKRLAPDAAILVVGVADQARKVDGEFRSYPSVERIRNAQRNAARRAGVAFWDLYEVMGGRNSIVSWVLRKPALAAKDYAHFSYYGQKLVARLMFSAMMKEYNHYLHRRVTAPPAHNVESTTPPEIELN